MHKGKGGAHYKKHGAREVCEWMEDELITSFEDRAGIILSPNERKALKSALWGACAVKHEHRAGTKEGNSIEQELGKAKNYRHRQDTGEWLNT